MEIEFRLRAMIMDCPPLTTDVIIMNLLCVPDADMYVVRDLSKRLSNLSISPDFDLRFEIERDIIHMMFEQHKHFHFSKIIRRYPKLISGIITICY